MLRATRSYFTLEKARNTTDADLRSLGCSNHQVLMIRSRPYREQMVHIHTMLVDKKIEEIEESTRCLEMMLQALKEAR